MDLLLELILSPFVALFQALAGILYPSKNPDIHRLQRFTVGFASVGMLSLIAAVSAAYVASSFRIFVTLGIVGYACLVIAGFIGYAVESRCRKAQSAVDKTDRQRPSANDLAQRP